MLSRPSAALGIGNLGGADGSQPLYDNEKFTASRQSYECIGPAKFSCLILT